MVERCRSHVGGVVGGRVGRGGWRVVGSKLALWSIVVV